MLNDGNQLAGVESVDIELMRSCDVEDLQQFRQQRFEIMIPYYIPDQRKAGEGESADRNPGLYHKEHLDQEINLVSAVVHEDSSAMKLPGCNDEMSSEDVA